MKGVIALLANAPMQRIIAQHIMKGVIALLANAQHIMKGVTAQHIMKGVIALLANAQHIMKGVIAQHIMKGRSERVKGVIAQHIMVIYIYIYMYVNDRNVLAQHIMKGVIALLANAPTFTYHQHFPTYIYHGVKHMQARVALFFLALVLHSHLHMKSSQKL